MAKKAFEIVELTLQDDTDVRIRPLPIARLRRFMSAWSATDSVDEKNDKEEDEMQGLAVLVNCCGIALEDSFKGKFDSLRAQGSDKDGEVLSADYKEYLEDVLDLDTIYVIMEVAGGIKLNDPKLMEAIQTATE